MIIPKDTEKDFGKIQHTFMIKTLQKVGIEGSHDRAPVASVVTESLKPNRP